MAPGNLCVTQAAIYHRLVVIGLGGRRYRLDGSFAAVNRCAAILSLGHESGYDHFSINMAADTAAWALILRGILTRVVFEQTVYRCSHTPVWEAYEINAYWLAAAQTRIKFPPRIFSMSDSLCPFSSSAAIRFGYCDTSFKPSGNESPTPS